MDVGTVPRRSAGLRARARGARLRAGRAPLGDRRQPAAPLLGPGRRAGARRRLRAGLPGLDRQGARFRLDPRGVRRDRRRGPGAGGQNPGAPGRAVRASPRRLRRPARHAALPLRLAQVVRGGPGARPEVRRGAPGPLRGRSRAGSTRRCRVHLLHLGDDGRPETVQRDLRELGPTLVLAPPRIWENILTGVQVKAADAPWLKRRVFEAFRAAAERAEILRGDGKPVPLGLRLAVALGEVFVYGPVRDQLGLRRARWALTGGAPLGPDTFRFFRSIGVNLKQVYGSTETTGLVSLQPDGEANPTTAGRPCPGIDVKIADRGEVLVKGPGVFKGYLKNEEATREVIDRDGWFHTGDAGFIDPRGHLVIIDRAKDCGVTGSGEPFAPQFIENKLKFSPFIREAVAFGDAKPYVTAMIAIDINTVGSWAERHSIAYTSYADLSQKPEVR